MSLDRKIRPITDLIRLAHLAVLVILSGCSHEDPQLAKEKILRDSLMTPRITILAGVPDIDKPVRILLENVPSPLKVTVPLQSGTNTNRQTTSASQVQRLAPPIIHSLKDPLTHLPVQADAQGKGFFTTYNTDNGLALDQIYCGYKDSKGNLWFGTNGGGVSKYDGKEFTNYTTAHGLANNIVWTIVEDKGGNLWFGTDGSGVSKYDGRIFTNYTKKQGLANNVVQSTTIDKKGNLWFGTLKGISKYDGRGFTNFTTSEGLVNDVVRTIIEDSAGNLWFGTPAGASKYDGHGFTNYLKIEGLANDTIRTILQDKSGNIWFGTNGGLTKFDGKTFTNYSTAQGLAHNVVNSINQDKSGEIWIGTYGGGTSRFDGKIFTRYSIAQGLANNIVESITEDETGYLWFGTFGGGLSKYGGKSFTNYTTSEGLSNNVVYSITKDGSGNLWFGTYGGGVCKYDGRSITNYTTRQGLVSNSIYCVARDKMNDLWFGSSDGGVCKYDGKTFTTYSTVQGLVNKQVFCILQDKAGNLWFATSGGVSKYDGKSFTNYTTRQGLASNEVFTMFEDKNGSLWFGTSGGGVTEFNGTSFINYTTREGLASNMIWAITEDHDGNLWFGTQDGLSMMSKETRRKISEKAKEKGVYSGQLFETFTTNDGLPDNFITQIVQAKDRKLYIGTNHGICEFLIQDSTRGASEKWTAGKIFNSSTGYPIKDVNGGEHAMFLDSSDIIWIGTGSDKTGLVRFDPNSLVTSNQKFPVIVFEQVKINNENICWNDIDKKQSTEKIDSNSVAASITEEVNTFGRLLTGMERTLMRKRFSGVSFDTITKWYPIPQNLILPYRFNNISFDFNAIETAKNYQVKYSYMLEGYDKNWSVPDIRTSAVFGNIYEGDYKFKLRVQNADGDWSEPINYSFKVLPPWTRTWWMYSLYAILIIAMVRLVFWWNHRRIIDQNKVLERKVTVATRQIREEKEIVESQKEKIETTLTKLRSTQAQLIQSEKMASLGELTAGIAHEIQNPLNFVNNFSEVSSELIDEAQQAMDIGNSDEAKLLLASLKENQVKINQHGHRADAIVKGMLQHSRASTGQKEPTDINALANEYFRLSYHGLRAKEKSFNATLKTDFDESLDKMNVVPQDIGRVLLNLYNNAFYATSAKALSTTAGIFEPCVSVSTKKVDDNVEIRVKDNGNGIPEKFLDKIFQPFFTTKPAGQGTGLGLSLSYDIIKAHGGQIKINTKEGEGSEFIIQLPIT
jgi:ligand-binding sensor domain-containing protein